jgi:LEA14-like dessication related protein
MQLSVSSAAVNLTLSSQLQRMLPRAPLGLVPAAARQCNPWLALAICGLLSACSVLAPQFTRPDLSVVGIDMLGGNLFQQNLRLTLKIHNPNERALPVSGLQVDLQIGGETIATGVSSRAFVVPANGDAECEVLINANAALGLLKLANQRDKPNGAVEYDLSGVVNIDLPLMRSLPFHQHGSFSLPGAGHG